MQRLSHLCFWEIHQEARAVYESQNVAIPISLMKVRFCRILVLQDFGSAGFWFCRILSLLHSPHVGRDPFLDSAPLLGKDQLHSTVESQLQPQDAHLSVHVCLTHPIAKVVACRGFLSRFISRCTGVDMRLPGLPALSGLSTPVLLKCRQEILCYHKRINFLEQRFFELVLTRPVPREFSPSDCQFSHCAVPVPWILIRSTIRKSCVYRNIFPAFTPAYFYYRLKACLADIQ